MARDGNGNSNLGESARHLSPLVSLELFPYLLTSHASSHVYMLTSPDLRVTAVIRRN